MQPHSIPSVLPVRLLRSGACLVLLSSLLSAGAPPLAYQKGDLRSKDAAVRLSAARTLVESGAEDLSGTLRRLLKDEDWEIVLLAARGLGEHGTEKDLRVLSQTAVTAPIRAVRLAAAESMGKLDAPGARDALLKKLESQPAYTCQALTAIAPQLSGTEHPAELVPLLKSESPGIREAAASAMLSLTRKEPESAFRLLMESGFLGVRTRGLEIAMEHPHPTMVNVLRQVLSQASINDVVLRRALPATMAAFDSIDRGAGPLFKETIQALCADELPEVAGRAALLAELAADKPWAKDLDLVKLLISSQRHKDPDVRTRAAHMLRKFTGAGTKKVAFAWFNRERDQRVRLALLKSILAMQPVGSDEGMHWTIQQLGRKPSPELAEEMVVALGDPMFVEETTVATALVEALEHPNWEVAACAAVSLGRTRHRWGAKSLMKMATEHGDWRLRGAAVVGLTYVARERSTPALIAALGDKDPAVAETAMSYLKGFRRGDSFEPDHREWTLWWEKEKGNIELHKAGMRLEREERYGPDAKTGVVFKGLDVMVLDGSDGSLVEAFERKQIQHRVLSRSTLAEAPLNARGVLVVNCETEWSEAELERLRWFAKVGGLISGSGGGPGQTVQCIEPGLVGVLDTEQKVEGTVIARARPQEAHLTRGVLDGDVVPMQCMKDSHLIEVLQPERVEVLIDSPDSAERWGGGNLSCWFRSGHGTVLDLASPVSSPTFPKALRLKKPRQRMAYAINHVGASYELIRETAKEKTWKSDKNAAKYLVDDSTLRLLTNFVRERRFAGH